MPVHMTDEQLRAWTREAEEGYDVDALKHEHAQRRKPLRDAHSHVDAPKPLEATRGGTHNEGSRSEALTAPLSGPQPKRAPPLTRGQQGFGSADCLGQGVIPAHAGSTGDKPRNPVVTSTLTVTTGSTDHPIEQPSVSNRAWAEGRDPGGAKTGQSKIPGQRAGGGPSPPATPCEPGHQKPEVSDMVQVLHAPGQHVSVAV